MFTAPPCTLAPELKDLARSSRGDGESGSICASISTSSLVGVRVSRIEKAKASGVSAGGAPLCANNSSLKCVISLKNKSEGHAQAIC